jgi:hypothetical protein
VRLVREDVAVADERHRREARHLADVPAWGGMNVRLYDTSPMYLPREQHVTKARPRDYPRATIHTPRPRSLGCAHRQSASLE